MSPSPPRPHGVCPWSIVQIPLIDESKAFGGPVIVELQHGSDAGARWDEVIVCLRHKRECRPTEGLDGILQTRCELELSDF